MHCNATAYVSDAADASKVRQQVPYATKIADAMARTGRRNWCLFLQSLHCVLSVASHRN